MTRCMVGSVTKRKYPVYVAILRTVNTPKGRMYRCFGIPSGPMEDLPVNAVIVYCAWCKKPRSMHVRNQCLFAATKFRPYTVQAERTLSKTHGQMLSLSGKVSPLMLANE